jgi:antitoxin MazE
VVKKWSNSAAVRIPASVPVTAQAHPVGARESGARIVIEPLCPARHDIETLVARSIGKNILVSVYNAEPGHKVW